MHNRLDKYLQQVAHELRSLPEAQRESELREMKQHLEAIVARLVEGGLSREEAMEAATAQFGAARSVGRELRHAGFERESVWRVAASIVGAAASYVGFMFVFTSTRDLLLKSTMLPGWLLTSQALLFCVPFASGVVAGRIAPEWGGVAVACVAGVAVVSLKPPVIWLPTVLGILLAKSIGAFVGSRWTWRRGLRVKGV